MIPDYATGREYAARVLADPDKHNTEEVAIAGLLQHLLPAHTLDEMTIAKRGDTVGMWATIDPGDGSRTWRGIIARASCHVALVCHPDDMRAGLKPTSVPANTVTPDPSVPRAWNADGTPARPEPAPDGDEKPAPALSAAALPDGWLLADHPEYGRVIVTNATPGSSGGIYCVASSDWDSTRFDWHYCAPGDLTYVDTAPPNTLTLGSVWENTDALEAACVGARRDQVTVIDCGGNVNVWDGHRGWWEGSAPLRYAPFTILHAGTKANR